MPSIRVVLCAALVLLTAACQKAEFEKTEPEAVLVSLSSGVISADDGSINVTASAVQDGVPLLEEPITVTVGGVCVAAPQTLPTDAGSGLATFTFSGLDLAGACTVTATARSVDSTASFTVVAGQPATLTLTDETTTSINAGEFVQYSTLVEDAAGNDVSIGVNLTVDSDAATFETDTSTTPPTTRIAFTEAGDFVVTAQLFDLTSTFDVTVAPATAAQVVTTLLQSSVGQQQTLVVTCGQFDAFGNARQFDFTATDVTTNPAAATIVEDTTPNRFLISGFSTFGIYTVACDDGTLNDVETFNVGQQAGANSVIATANLAQIEAGTGTVDVTCDEVDGFGNSTGFNFQSGTSFTTTAPGASITESSPNVFTVSNVTAIGSFSATCDSGTDTDAENFAVVDTTAPSFSTFSFSGTAPFAAGSTVTINADVIDAIGVAFESIAIVSGPGEIVGSSVNFESGTADPPSRTFQVRVNGSVGVSSTVVVRGQVADTTGNLRSTTSDLSIGVNAAGTIVTATLSSPTLEAGGSIVVTCDERNAVTGSSANTVFNAGTDILLGTAGHIITSLGSNRFSLSGYTVKRSETVTCDGVSDTDLATFNVVDTTPPTASTAVNPVQANYAAGTSVDVTVTASDVVGLANASLVVASGNATITSASVKALGGAASSAPVFTVRLDGSTTGASVVTLIAQVADTTGNVREPAQITLSVNAAPTAVVTTLAGTAIEHNQTLDFTCKQINAATGADTGATFVLGETGTTASGGVISSLGSNAFRITGPFTAKGSATVTCTKSAQSDVETVTIYDATAPTIGTLSALSATGPNGVTGDNRYAPGTTVTVRVSTAADGIGLSRVDLAATGASNVSPSTRFVSGTAASNLDFDVHIAPDAATFATIAITAQASDTTGNTSAVTSTLTLTVDPGAGLTVASGVTLRTLYEGTIASGMPTGMSSNGTDLFVQRLNGGGTIQDVAKLTGSTAPATLSVAIGSGFPASVAGNGGIANDAGGAFGATSSIFHGLFGATPQIGTESGTTHARFDTNTAPVIPYDLAIGNVGPGTRLFTLDDNGGGSTRLLKSINTGATVPYSAGGDTALNGCRSLVKDANAARLLIACPNGEIRAVTDTGGDLGNASTLVTTIPGSDALDIASTATDTFVAGGTDSTVHRVGDTAISSQFQYPAAVVIKSGDSSSLNVLDVGATTWRVYRVTGY